MSDFLTCRVWGISRLSHSVFDNPTKEHFLQQKKVGSNSLSAFGFVSYSVWPTCKPKKHAPILCCFHSFQCSGKCCQFTGEVSFKSQSFSKVHLWQGNTKTSKQKEQILYTYLSVQLFVILFTIFCLGVHFI